MTGFDTSGKRTELIGETLEVIKSLNDTIRENSRISSTQNNWMIGLTVAITILSIVMVIQPFLNK